MMRAAWWSRLLPAALLAVASTGMAGGDVGFESDVVPLLNVRCVVCHVDGAAQGDLSLYPDPWGHLVGAASTQSSLRLVEPGAPDKSYLYLKVLGTHVEAGGSGLRMPFAQDPLSVAEIEVLRSWIANGAQR